MWNIYDFQNNTVTDNFDKLVLMIASNQFELAQTKLYAIRNIFWTVDVEDDSNGYITDDHSNAFDQLVQYEEEITKAIEKLDNISEKFQVKFILSVSKNEEDLPECAKDKIIISL